MNLFFARLTGKIKSADKFEKQLQDIKNITLRYREVEQSSEMKEYLELKEKVDNPRFAEKKREYKNKKYKDTVEYKNHSEYLKLQKDKTVKRYLTAANDEERDKIKGAIVVKNYMQLCAIVEAPDFEERRAFWADSKRWEKTEESRLEARYNELAASDDIRFFLNAPKKDIEAYELMHKTFGADFSDASLEKNGLKTGFWFKAPALKRDFSYVDEDLAYLGENNINIQDGVLSVVTQKGEVEAPAWAGEKKGFVMHTFPYSSANIHTGDTFEQEEGIFEVKVRASGKCHSAVYLVGEDRFPIIEIFHFDGKHINIGYTDKNTRKEEVLRGIKANDWQCFGVLVNRYEIAWQLNGTEIYRTKNPLPGQKLHFTAQSFAKKGKGAEGKLDIAWIKAFEK